MRALFRFKLAGKSLRYSSGGLKYNILNINKSNMVEKIAESRELGAKRDSDTWEMKSKLHPPRFCREIRGFRGIRRECAVGFEYVSTPHRPRDFYYISSLRHVWRTN